MKKLLTIIIIAILVGGVILAKDSGNKPTNPNLALSENNNTEQLNHQHTAVHNCGKLYMTFVDGIYGHSLSNQTIDPESGDLLLPMTYPKGSYLAYLWAGSIWIGGIVDGDTLVSVGTDGWLGAREIVPEDKTNGNTYRTGHFADDEFLSIAVDTIIQSNASPLGLEIKQHSHSWADTLYDDFVIIDYTVINIGDKNITEGWAGLYLDCDVQHAGNISGFNDDCSGVLEVSLNENIPEEKSLIAYTIDNDGDPKTGIGYAWNEKSPRGAISARLLGASFTPEHQNFNWWFPNGDSSLAYGPRQLDKPSRVEDPYPHTPVINEDMYIEMSYPEVDFDQLEILLHGPDDGWHPPPQLDMAIDFANGFDTRFLLSFGPFDLPPSDSISFSIAFVAADYIHVNPDDFTLLFDPQNPGAYYNSFDFSELLLHHQRAEEVYQSGLTAPHPPPPAGMIITAYDDNFIDVAWNFSKRPDLAGYSVYYRDTLIDNDWHKASQSTATDTTFRFDVSHPSHSYQLAVSLTDNQNRESKLSIPVEIIPASPHPVLDISLVLDGLIPEISWVPYLDISSIYYIVYRGNSSDSLSYYDISAGNSYIDINVESGGIYYYAVSSSNGSGLESELSRTVRATPMAMDEGIVLFDFNGHSESGPFYREYLLDLYRSSLSIIPSKLMRYYDLENPWPLFADHSVVIFDMESRNGYINSSTYDRLKDYFDNEGKAIIICIAPDNVYSRRVLYEFNESDFFYDYLKLNGYVTNGVILHGGGMDGDLVGCKSLHPDYEDLNADTARLARSVLHIPNYIPMSGYLMPTEEAEPIYSYVSSNSDTINHGQINGIRYIGDDYQFVLLNFPLTLMEGDAKFRVMHQALSDLGIDVYCGDASDDKRINLGDVVFIIGYLFKGGPAPVNQQHADVNCDGQINLADAITFINYIFKDGPQLKCCP